MTTGSPDINPEDDPEYEWISDLDQLEFMCVLKGGLRAGVVSGFTERCNLSETISETGETVQETKVTVTGKCIETVIVSPEMATGGLTLRQLARLRRRKMRLAKRKKKNGKRK